MRFAACELFAFRNVGYALLQAHPRFNVLWGENGEGKTNFLEALYLVGTLRSFRAGRLDELIKFGEPRAVVRARTEQGGTTRLVEVTVQPGQKLMKVDGKSLRSTDYRSGVNVVLFAPEDLLLPRGAPSARRRFLDRAIWNLHPSYLGEAQTYERVLKARNALLRADQLDVQQLAVYDEQLARAAVPIVERRRTIVEGLAPRVAEVVARLLGPSRRFTMRYRSTVDAAEPAAIEATVRAQLAANRPRDRVRGTTSVGPHHDDLELLLDDRAASAFASQGQARALVLSLKIAEIGLVEATLGEPPVLLLDDVSSELDAERNAQLFSFLAETRCQTFLTTTHPRHVLLQEDRKDFQVVSGSIAG